MFAEEGVLGVPGEETALAGARHPDQDDLELRVLGFGDSFPVAHFVFGIYFLLSYLYLMSRGRAQTKKVAFNAKEY